MAKRYDDNEETTPQYSGSASKHKDPHPKDPQCIWKDYGLRCGTTAVCYPGHSREGYCRLHSLMLDGYYEKQARDMLQDMQRQMGRRPGESWVDWKARQGDG